MIFGNPIGRRVIYTDEAEITNENIIKVLQNAYAVHLFNASDVERLLRYEGGVQPILPKITRTDIDAQVVDNVANEIASFKCAYNWGNTITLSQRGDIDSGDNRNENKAIALLNEMYAAEFNGRKQQELARFVEICGIGYTFIDVNARWRKGRSYFTYDVLHPGYTFIVRSSRLGHRKMLGVTYSVDAQMNQHFTCFTEDTRYEIDGIGGVADSDGKVVGTTGIDWKKRERNGEMNPLGMIPIIEWQRDADRMGCFERQIPELDNINQLTSDLSNGIRQNVNSLWWANNVEFPTETVTDDDGNTEEVATHPDSGDWIETTSTRDGKDPRIEPLVANYDYEGQLNNILARRSLVLQKCHVPQGGDSSNSTGLATSSALGWDAAESDASKEELFIKSAKLEEVEVALSAIDCSECPADNPVRKLTYMDVEPSVKRKKNYDLVSKINFFATGVSHGIHPRPLIQAMDTFGDPEQVYLDSKPYLDKYIEATFEKNESGDTNAYNGYGMYPHNVSKTGEGGSGEKAANADRMGQDESDQVKNSPKLKG